MKKSKNNIKNIGTRQRFAAGNPVIAISFAFSRFFCLLPKKKFAIALSLIETEGVSKKSVILGTQASPCDSERETVRTDTPHRF